MTKSMKNTFENYGDFIMIDTTYNIDHFNLIQFTISTIDLNKNL